MLNPTKDNLVFDAKKVEEVMGVPPALVPDVMALMGDSIDNIPGAKGIGVTRAPATTQHRDRQQEEDDAAEADPVPRPPLAG